MNDYLTALKTVDGNYISFDECQNFGISIVDRSYFQKKKHSKKTESNYQKQVFKKELYDCNVIV